MSTHVRLHFIVPYGTVLYGTYDQEREVSGSNIKIDKSIIDTFISSTITEYNKFDFSRYILYHRTNDIYAEQIKGRSLNLVQSLACLHSSVHKYKKINIDDNIELVNLLCTAEVPSRLMITIICIPLNKDSKTDQTVINNAKHLLLLNEEYVRYDKTSLFYDAFYE